MEKAKEASDGQVASETEATPKRKFKIDLERVRAKADDLQQIGVTTEFTNVPVRNPKPDEFFRAHPDADYQVPLHILPLKSDNEWYCVDPGIAAQLVLETQLRLMKVYTCCTMNNTPFLTCIPLPDSLGKINSWHQSGHLTMEEAMQEWVRRQADKSNGGYTITKALSTNLPDPVFPKMSFQELVEKAFDKFYIDSMDHPVLQRLRGERMV